jgi:hypothetical protein
VQVLNDVTGELLAVKLVQLDADGPARAAAVEALRVCCATRHPNLVRCGHTHTDARTHART